MTGGRPTLILISGLLSDAAVWQPVVDAFSGTMPVVTVSLDDSGSFTHMAEKMLGENPGDLVVVGHSMGARVALEVYRLAPERVVKMAMLDTGVHPLQHGETESRQKLLDLAHRESMAAIANKWLPPMVHPARVDDDVLMGILTDMVLRADANLYERQVRAMLDRPDAESVLPTIACPVLLAVGRQDSWSPIARHKAMCQHIQHVELVIIEEAGHFAPLEQPQAFISALNKWMNA